MGIHDIQIGDRVQCIKKYEIVREGKTGTVCNMGDYDPPIGVYWDNDIGGHDCGRRCPNRHGYYIPLRCITRISEEDLDLDPAVGLI